jgi:hypothetical protein
VGEELETESGGAGLRYSFEIQRGSVTQEVGVHAKTGKALENWKTRCNARIRLSSCVAGVKWAAGLRVASTVSLRAHSNEAVQTKVPEFALTASPSGVNLSRCQQPRRQRVNRVAGERPHRVTARCQTQTDIGKNFGVIVGERQACERNQYGGRRFM